MTRMTPRIRHQLIEGLNDDPGGFTHPIWTELGKPPQPPISVEERALIDEACKISDPTDSQTVAATPVWYKNENGIWGKLWQLRD